MSILTEAITLVDGDRQAMYGPPASDYARVGQITSAALSVEWTACDALVQMLAVKLARIGHGVSADFTAQELRDSLVDLAGYAHCLHEALIERDRTRQHADLPATHN